MHRRTAVAQCQPQCLFAPSAGVVLKPRLAAPADLDRIGAGHSGMPFAEVKAVSECGTDECCRRPEVDGIAEGAQGRAHIQEAGYPRSHAANIGSGQELTPV